MQPCTVYDLFSTQLQHWAAGLPERKAAWAHAHPFWRVLHPHAPIHHGNHFLCHSLLEQGTHVWLLALTTVRSMQGEMAAMFLRHEGFLGAVGAFLKVHPMQDTRGREARKVSCTRLESNDRRHTRDLVSTTSTCFLLVVSQQVRANFVERWTMGAPFSGGEVHGPAIRDVGGKIEWYDRQAWPSCCMSSIIRVERFVQLGAEVTGDNEEEHDRYVQSPKHDHPPGVMLPA